MEKIIQETRDFLIKEHGEPYVKIVDGKKFRFINTELDNFDKLIELIKFLSNSYNIEIREEQIKVICDFAKTEVQPNIVNVINKFKRFKTEREKKINFGRKSMIKLLDDLESYYYDKEYSPTYIMNLFVKNLRCASIYHKENFKSLM